MASFALRGAWANLYDHQLQAVTAARVVRSGYITMACGAGKTAVAVAICTDPEADNQDVLIVAGGRGASMQLLEEVQKNTTLHDQGRLTWAFDGDEKSSNRPATSIHITSYDYLKKRLALPHGGRSYTKKQYHLVILDECHRALAEGAWNTIKKVITKDVTRVIGLTGTPFRNPSPKELEGSAIGKSLLQQSSAFLEPLGPCFFAVRAKELEEQGLIAKMRFEFVTVPLGPDMANYASLDGNERRDTAALNRNKALIIASIVKKHWERGETGIIFVQKLACADAILRMAELPFMQGIDKVTGDKGKKSVAAHDRHRKEVLRKLEAKEVPAAVMTSAAEEGMNVRSISYVILSDGPGNSIRSDTQRAGRGARNVVTGEQKNATIYSLNTEGTHEITEKQAYVDSIREQGYLGDEVVTYRMDVEETMQSTGVSEQLLHGVAQILVTRQEEQAGQHHKQKVTKQRKVETTKNAEKRRAEVQRAHHLFKEKVSKRVANQKAVEDKKTVEMSEAAQAEGKEMYRNKKQKL